MGGLAKMVKDDVVAVAAGLSSLSNDALIRGLRLQVDDQRRSDALVVAHLVENEDRKIHLSEGYSSMFAYSTEGLHMSEGETALRLRVARAARAFPVVLQALASGAVHLSGLAVLAPHFKKANVESLLGRARHRSKRDIEAIAADVAPRPDVPPRVRRTRGRSGPTGASGTEMPPARQSAVVPLGRTTPSPTTRPLDPAKSVATEPGAPAAGGAMASGSATTLERDHTDADEAEPLCLEPEPEARYAIQFTASARLRDKLRRLQALLGVGEDDLAGVVEAAVDAKITFLEKRRYALTDRPRSQVADADTTPRSRVIPAAIRREVAQRDGGRCSFVGASGHRCGETRHLQFHHRVPYARAGAHSVDNLCLRCRAHNQYEAERDFGEAVMARYRKGPGRGTQGRLFDRVAYYGVAKPDAPARAARPPTVFRAHGPPASGGDAAFADT